MSHRNDIIRAVAICAISMAFIAGFTGCTREAATVGTAASAKATGATSAEDMPEVVIVASRSQPRSASVIGDEDRAKSDPARL